MDNLNKEGRDLDALPPLQQFQQNFYCYAQGSILIVGRIVPTFAHIYLHTHRQLLIHSNPVTRLSEVLHKVSQIASHE